MGIDTSDRREGAASEGPAAGPLAQLRESFTSGLRELQWGPVLLFGVLCGVLMPFSVLQGTGNVLSFFTGLIPVGTGLLLGRRIKGRYTLHGFFTGLIGAVISLLGTFVLVFLTPLGAAIAQQAVQQGVSTTLITPQSLFLQFGGLSAFALLVFVTFGTSIAGRTEERNRALREELDRRGGRLERPNTIRTLEDLRGLSLPQLGSYVRSLFEKQGFRFKDYRFIDKDKHLDMWMEHEGEVWHLRLSVADKVSTGTIESLNQELRREGRRKGVVITSTEFQPGALKAGKGRRTIVLIDGPTLFEIAEK